MRRYIKFNWFMIAVFLVAIIFGTSIPPVYAGSSSDIDGHWGQGQIEKLMALEVVKGYPDGTFKPNRTVTRAEYVTMINKAFQFGKKAAGGFTDVKATDWFAEQLGAAQAAGYLAGYEDGTARPNNNINRQESAVMISKVMKSNAPGATLGGFKDAHTISLWARESIASIIQSGVMSGYPDQTFKPQKLITRAEAAAAICLALEREKADTKPAEDLSNLNQAGTYGPAYGSQSISGNCVIRASGVVLQNVVIKGDLLIADSVAEGDVTLKNVTVEGTANIQGGGENSIAIQNSIFAKMIVKKQGKVRIVSSGTTRISELIANSALNFIGPATIAKATINVTGVTIQPSIANLTIASGISASVGGKSVSGTPASGGGGGGGSPTAASVGSAAELTTALANGSITTITLNSSFTASPTITRSITMNFGTHTITGDVTFSHAGTGTTVLTGTAASSIVGDLTVNTANASFNNGIRVSGSVNVVNVKVGSWTESADGNTLTITDPDGAIITVTGSPGSVTVTQDAGGKLTVTVNPGANVTNITTNAPVNIVVSAGATVTSITAGAGSDNTTITNDGTTGTVAANAPINLVANVAPAKTVTGASGSVTTSGTNAASVNVVRDLTPPTLSSPSVSAVGDVTASLNFTSNKAGRYYYLVYAVAAAAPDAASIKAQGAAIAKGAGTAAAANTVKVTSLTAATAYKAYLMVEDAAENASAVATIDFTTIAALTVTSSHGSGPVLWGTAVSLASAPGADIYYTVDGSDPTTASLLYTKPLVITQNATIKAMAAKAGMANSAVFSAEFTVSANPAGQIIGFEGPEYSVGPLPAPTWQTKEDRVSVVSSNAASGTNSLRVGTVGGGDGWADLPVILNNTMKPVEISVKINPQGYYPGNYDGGYMSFGGIGVMQAGGENWAGALFLQLQKPSGAELKAEHRTICLRSPAWDTWNGYGKVIGTYEATGYHAITMRWDWAADKLIIKIVKPSGAVIDYEEPLNGTTAMSYIRLYGANEWRQQYWAWYDDLSIRTVTPDTTAPTLSGTSASEVTQTTATLNFTSDEAGTYYYLVYATAAAAPDAKTIKALGDAAARGSGMAHAAPNTISVTGLTAATAYKAYVIVEDTAGNDSAVATIDITTTTDSAIPVTLNGIIVDADRIIIGVYKTVSGQDSGIDDLSILDFSLIKDFGQPGEQAITGISLSIDPLGGTWEYDILPPTGQVFAPGTYRLTFSKAGYQAKYVTVEIAEPYPAPVPGTVNGDMMHWKIETDGLEANTDYDIQLKDDSLIWITTDANRDIIFNADEMQALIDQGPDTLQIRRCASDTNSASAWVDLLAVTSMGEAPTGIIRGAGPDGIWGTGDEQLINTTETYYMHVEWKIGDGGWNGDISGTPAFLGGVGGMSATEISGLTIPSPATSIKIRRQGQWDMLASATYEVP